MVALKLFRKVQKRMPSSFYTPMFGSMGQTAVIAFFTGRTDKLLDARMFWHAKIQDFSRELVRLLIMSPAFTEAVARFFTL